MDGMLINKVKQFINQNNLLDEGTKVVLGLSGGADSTALLLILLRLGYRVHAVHCNFHLRGNESNRDQEFVTELCRKNGVELTICDYDTRGYAIEHGLSIEMAARELRYADFERVGQQCEASAICIAHHRDDSVETVLLNLIRGTGIKGLTGIKPRNGYIIRPLLCVSRQEIEDWLHSIGQPYVTDSTNLETDYTRNKIRLQLIPLMRSINPDADNAIADTANHLQQAYTIYSQAIEDAKNRIVKGTESNMVISIPKLKSYPVPGAILFQILSPLGFNSTQVTDIQAAMDSQPGTRFQTATHQLIKDRDAFIVTPVDGVTDSVQITVSLNPGTSVALPDGRTLTVSYAPAGTPISTDLCVATFDAALLTENSITIRRWHNGDRFVPFGMKGSKLVSDYLTDIKTSAAQRNHQLVATCGNEIIWVIGCRSDNRYRITPKTQTQLVLTIG